jgi:ribosomal protein S27E
VTELLIFDIRYENGSDDRGRFDLPDIKCPRCGQYSISLWSKMVASPAGTITCPNCRSNLIVPMSGWWTSLPAFAAVVIALWSIDSLVGQAIIVAAGIGLSAWLNHKYTRLE